MRSTRILAALFAGVLVFAACGGDDDDDDTAATEASGDDSGGDDSADDDSGDDDDGGGGDDDACALVTADDAQALFGDEFEVQQAEDASPVELGSSCLYENVGGDELGNPSHLLQFRVYDGEQFYGEDLYEGEEELDIGDQGFIVAQEGLGGVSIQFLKDGKTVTLDYTIINIGVEGESVNATDKQDQVIALAEQVADEM